MAQDSPQFWGKAYGYIIQSDSPLLPPLARLDGNADVPLVPDILIHQGQLGDLATSGSADQIISAKIPGFGKFWMIEGRELVVDPEAPRSLADLRPIILGSAMAVLLQQRQQLVLHASCIGIGGQAIAFLGNSGWGKSTLASVLHSKGYDFVTDDVLAINVQSTPPKAVSSYPEVRLLPDTLEALGHTLELEETDQSFHWKQEKRVSSRISEQPLPLLCLYVLAGGSTLEAEAIAPPSAFLELSHHSRAIRVVNSLHVPSLRARHFQQCMTLVQKVPLFYLRRRRSLAELSQVVTFLESHVAQLLDQERTRSTFSGEG